MTRCSSNAHATHQECNVTDLSPRALQLNGHYVAVLFVCLLRCRGVSASETSDDRYKREPQE